MGYQDREYYREQPPQAGLDLGDSPLVIKLILVNVAAFFADFLLAPRDHWITRMLALTPETLHQPLFWWRFVTYGFTHAPPPEMGHIFWNMFGLFLFGRDVEGVYGKKEFLRFYLVSVVIGGIVYAFRQRFLPLDGVPGGPSLVGASGAVCAVTLLYCLHFPHRTILFMMVLPMPAWAIGAIMILGNFVSSISPRDQVAYDVHLAGIAFAILYYRFQWRLSWLGLNWRRVNLLRRRPRLKLVRTFHDDLIAEGDALLQKVQEQGLESLTPREKKTLEDYSRLMRQKHP